MSEWSHLPNRHHIDWVIESVKQNPQLWYAAEAEAEAAAAWDLALNATLGTAWRAAQYAARDEAWDAAWDAVSRAMGSWWPTTVRASVLALVAYDDCDQYINMGYEKLQVYATLSEKPQALLLLPMVYVREKLNERMVTFT